jgi:hypothetical protein
MPSLRAVIFEGQHNVPVGWMCTECETAFDFGRMELHPSTTQIEQLNRKFAFHCEKYHPDSTPVIGLQNRKT